MKKRLRHSRIQSSPLFNTRRISHCEQGAASECGPDWFEYMKPTLKHISAIYIICFIFNMSSYAEEGNKIRVGMSAAFSRPLPRSGL